MAKRTVVSRVYEALDEDIYLRAAIQMGVANISAVSERIRGEAAPDASREAVRAAMRRYISEMGDTGDDDALAKLLETTEFSLRSNISVVQAYQDRRAFSKLQDTLKSAGREFNIISSAQAITIITSDDRAPEIMKQLGRENIISHQKGLHAIYLASRKDIKSIPGFVAFISGLFLRKNINIVEFYSCYTDTVLIVSRQDSLKAYALLDRALGKRRPQGK